MVGSEATLEIRVLHRHDKSIREIARARGSRATRFGAICGTRMRRATSRVRPGRGRSTRSRAISSNGGARRRRNG